MENIVYKTEIELKGCTLEEFNELRNRLYGTVTEKIDLSPYYQQKTKERILLVEMQKAREHLQELCDNAYGKGNRVIMVAAQKSI